MQAKLWWLDRAVFAVALVILVIGAAGGPRLGVGAGETVLAVQLDHGATAPLYDAFAGAVAAIPVGEPAFRLGVLGAVLGALTLLGVLRASRALLPKDPLAGIAGALILFVSPPFRDAAGSGSPALLAACAAVWAFAGAVQHARLRAAAAADERAVGEPTAKKSKARRGAAHTAPMADGTSRSRRGPRPTDRAALAAVAWSAVALGGEPWFGLALLLAVAAWVQRSRVSRVVLGAAAVLAAALWAGAVGDVPQIAPDLSAAVANTGRGAAAVVVGAGLLGAAFGAITALPRAAWLAVAIALAALDTLAVGGHDPVPLLALLAVGAAVLPSAIVRAASTPAEGSRRHLIALGASVPLLAAAALSGAALGIDDPGSDVPRLAADLVGEQPAGPGILVETREASWIAASYAQRVSGLRPDFTLAPPLSSSQGDVAVANALRRSTVAGSDVFVFGRLDPRRAMPRGRGFELLGAAPTHAAIVQSPAAYRSATGRQQSVLLALDRARYEAGAGRLEAAARAAGLQQRFGAGDLAVLAASVPTTSRPAFFGFIPAFDTPTGPWLLDLFGDDLAWVSGISQPPLPDDAPVTRRLHAVWRRIWRGEIAVGDPSIAALGPEALRATSEMLTTLKK